MPYVSDVRGPEWAQPDVSRAQQEKSGMGEYCKLARQFGKIEYDIGLYGDVEFRSSSLSLERKYSPNYEDRLCEIRSKVELLSCSTEELEVIRFKKRVSRTIKKVQHAKNRSMKRVKKDSGSIEKALKVLRNIR